MTQIIGPFGDAHKLWSSFLCIFLPSFVTYSLLGKHIFISNMFSNNLKFGVYKTRRRSLLEITENILTICSYRMVLICQGECRQNSKY